MLAHFPRHELACCYSSAFTGNRSASECKGNRPSERRSVPFLANHVNNDTKCTPGSRWGAFYSVRGAFFEGGVHFSRAGCSSTNWNLLVCCICHNYDIPVHSPARFFQDFPRNIFLYRKRLSIPITTLSTINRMIRSAISLSIWTVASTILITNLDVISIIKTVVKINIAFFICGILHSTILQCWQ